MYEYDVNQKYVAQVPSFSAMPTSNSRISLGPAYQVNNDVSLKVKPKYLYIFEEVNRKPLTQMLMQDFNDEELPQVDLKGHTVEELAKAANVTVDVIQAAIKMRQQQLLLEKRNYANQLKEKISNYVKVRITPPTTSIRTTQSTTTARSTTTTSYALKTKVHHKQHPIAGGHKVERQ